MERVIGPTLVATYLYVLGGTWRPTEERFLLFSLCVFPTYMHLVSYSAYCKYCT